MSLRKITSLTALLSFVAMLATSIILYVVPQGRVAYWADWHLLGLDKTQWGDLHINMGLLFLLAITLHIGYNWKAILAYLRDRTRRIRMFTPDSSAALAITLALTVGTLFSIPPFDWPLVFNTRLKAAAAVKYGEPPYGHAELSPLEQLAHRSELDLSAALAALQAAGIRVESPRETLQTIARRNGRTPRDLFQIMQGTRSAAVPQQLPAAPLPGTGQKTLTDLCQAYGLPVEAMAAALRQDGLQFDPQLTLKEIGAKNGVSPQAVYASLRQAAAAVGAQTR